jgi:hypothetical protein
MSREINSLKVDAKKSLSIYFVDLLFKASATKILPRQEKQKLFSIGSSFVVQIVNDFITIG